jgi:hypothetical protein
MEVLEINSWRGRAAADWKRLSATGRWIKEAVLEGNVVHIRRFFPADLMAAAREHCRNWALSDHAENLDVAPACRDFHRIDDSLENLKIRIGRRLHRFFFMPWNRPPSKAVQEMGFGAFRLRNAMMGFPEDAFRGDPRQEAFGHLAIMHYPRGGGYLSPHADPIEPALAEVGVAMSRLGEDFRSGGFWIMDPLGNRVEMAPRVEPGDVFLFRQDFLHGVAPIDDDAGELDWSDFSGRWAMHVPVRQPLPV